MTPKQTLDQIEGLLSDYGKVPSDVFIGTNSVADKITWLVRRLQGFEDSRRLLQQARAAIAMPLEEMNVRVMAQNMGLPDPGLSTLPRMPPIRGPLTVLITVGDEVRLHAEFADADQLDNGTIDQKVFKIGTRDILRQLEFWSDLVEQGK